MKRMVIWHTLILSIISLFQNPLLISFFIILTFAIFIIITIISLDVIRTKTWCLVVSSLSSSSHFLLRLLIHLFCLHFLLLIFDQKILLMMSVYPLSVSFPPFLSHHQMASFSSVRLVYGRFIFNEAISDREGPQGELKIKRNGKELTGGERSLIR